MHQTRKRGATHHSLVGIFIPLTFAASVAAASLTARAHYELVSEPPKIGLLELNPDPVTMQQPLTLIARNVTDADGNSTVTDVMFYRDNGDGHWNDGNEIPLGSGVDDDADTDWELTVTVSWDAGPLTYYAVAVDETMMKSKPVKVYGLVLAPGDRHWSAAQSGCWENPDNWQELVVPAMDDTARFTVPGAFEVTFPRKSAVTTKGLIIDGSSPTIFLTGDYVVDDPAGSMTLIVGDADPIESSLTVAAFEAGLGVENVTIGAEPNVTGSIAVSGFDSRLTSTGELIVGDEGMGMISVDQFCSLESAIARLGREPGSEGHILISGHNAIWLANDLLVVGERGHGSVTINNEAFVTLDRIRIALEENSTGMFEIPVAALVSATNLTIGGSESAKGGVGTAHIGFFGFLDLDEGLVVWDGSTLSIDDGLLTTGFGEDVFVTVEGEVFIENGGRLNHPNTAARLGFAAEAMNAIATVTGEGSQWRMSTGAAGYHGHADVLIADGGSAETTSAGFTLGLETGSFGKLTLADPGTTWSSVGPIVVGANGVGELNILDGATMQTMGSWIATSADAAGSRAHLSGSGSTWNLTGQLFIGGDDMQPGGAAELTIDNGATVSAPSAQSHIWPTGTLTLAGGVLDGFSTLNDGGTVQGTGLLMTQLVDAGLMLPGGAQAIGHLHVTNGWSKQEGGCSHFEIAGDKPALYDRVTADGGITLNGTLILSFIDGYTPKAGDEYIIVSGSPVADEFTEFALPSMPPGRELIVIYEGNRVVVKITSIFQQQGGGEKRDPNQVNNGGGGGG